MSTPLRTLLTDVLFDPATRAEFTADPHGFLDRHGWSDLDGDDVRSALTVLGDELPADQVAAVAPALDADRPSPPDAADGLLAVVTMWDVDTAAHVGADPADALDDLDDLGDIDDLDDLDEPHHEHGVGSSVDPIDEPPGHDERTHRGEDAPDDDLGVDEERLRGRDAPGDAHSPDDTGDLDDVSDPDEVVGFDEVTWEPERFADPDIDEPAIDLRFAEPPDELDI